MHSVEVREGIEIAFEDEYFGPPWSEPLGTVMLIHGVAESSRAWVQWVPILSPHLRVLRPDLPGFGFSPVPLSYDWTPDQYSADLVGLLDALEIAKVHLVAAKYGGTIAMQLASAYPSRVSTLSVFSSPVSPPSLGIGAVERIQRHGVRAWAAASERGRLGSTAPEAQIRWWTDELMGEADDAAVLGCQRAVARWNIKDNLGRIESSTVIVTAEKSPLQTLDVVRDYQTTIPNSALKVLPGDSFHPAAIMVDKCASIALEHIWSMESRRSDLDA